MIYSIDTHKPNIVCWMVLEYNQPDQSKWPFVTYYFCNCRYVSNDKFKICQKFNTLPFSVEPVSLWPVGVCGVTLVYCNWWQVGSFVGHIVQNYMSPDWMVGNSLNPGRCNYDLKSRGLDWLDKSMSNYMLVDKDFLTCRAANRYGISVFCTEFTCKIREYEFGLQNTEIELC